MSRFKLVVIFAIFLLVIFSNGAHSLATPRTIELEKSRNVDSDTLIFAHVVSQITRC